MATRQPPTRRRQSPPLPHELLDDSSLEPPSVALLSVSFGSGSSQSDCLDACDRLQRHSAFQVLRDYELPPPPNMPKMPDEDDDFIGDDDQARQPFSAADTQTLFQYLDDSATQLTDSVERLSTGASLAKLDALFVRLVALRQLITVCERGGVAPTTNAAPAAAAAASSSSSSNSEGVELPGLVEQAKERADRLEAACLYTLTDVQCVRERSAQAQHLIEQDAQRRVAEKQDLVDLMREGEEIRPLPTRNASVFIYCTRTASIASAQGEQGPCKIARVNFFRRVNAKHC